MMLDELQTLLDTAPSNASQSDYLSSVVDANALILQCLNVSASPTSLCALMQPPNDRLSPQAGRSPLIPRG